MQSSRVLHPLGLVLLLAPTGAALQAPTTMPTGHHTFDWTPLTADFRRVEVGEFNGDGVPDALVVTPDQLVTMVGPSAFDAMDTLPFVADDATVVLGSGLGTNDSIVFVDGTGLYETYLAPMPSDPTTLEWVVETITTVAWDDAVRIESVDLGGYAEHDLVGLDANQISFLSLTRDPLDNWTYFPTFDAPNTLPESEFDFIDCDLDSVLDVACVTDQGLEMVRYDESVLWSLSHTNYANGRVTVFEESGVDRIAWLREDGSADQELVVVDIDGTAETAVPLGVLGCISLEAGDMNGDGRDDLVLTDTSTHKARVLFNTGVSGATYDYDPNDSAVTKEIFYGPASTTNPNNVARPLFYDMNGDDHADLILPKETSTTSIRYKDGRYISQGSSAPDPITVTGTLDEGSETYLTLDYDATGAGSNKDCVVGRVIRSNIHSSAEPEVISSCTVPINTSGATELVLPLNSGDLPTPTGPNLEYLYEAWFGVGEYHDTIGAPEYDASRGAVGRISQYQFAMSGPCNTWPEPYFSDEKAECTSEVSSPPGAPGGGVVGVFSSTERIEFYIPRDPWPPAEVCEVPLPE